MESAESLPHNLIHAALRWPYVRPLLYDQGFIACFDAKDGKELYGKRRLPNGRSFTSSPWAYNGKVFCLNEDGMTFVIKAGDVFEEVGTNPLAEDDMCMATPAIAGDRLIIRTSGRGSIASSLRPAKRKDDCSPHEIDNRRGPGATAADRKPEDLSVPVGARDLLEALSEAARARRPALRPAQERLAEGPRTFASHIEANGGNATAALGHSARCVTEKIVP